MSIKDYLWVEKYRPTKLSDLIVPNHVRELLDNMIKTGSVVNMLFQGDPGCGKGSTYNVLCNELGLECEVINASETNGIDHIRNYVEDYSSAVSLNGKVKMLVFDEADGLTPQAQFALRNKIEKFHKNTRYIFTCNEPDKIIPALKDSRLHNINFNFNELDLKEMVPIAVKRCFEICKDEGVELLDRKSFYKFVEDGLPNMRKIINELQSYAIANDNKIPKIKYNEDVLDLKKIGKVLNGSYDDITEFVETYDNQTIIKFLYENSYKMDKNKVLDLNNIISHFDFRLEKSLFKKGAMITMLLNIQNIIRGYYGNHK